MPSGLCDLQVSWRCPDLQDLRFPSCCEVNQKDDRVILRSSACVCLPHIPPHATTLTLPDAVSTCANICHQCFETRFKMRLARLLSTGSCACRSLAGHELALTRGFASAAYVPHVSWGVPQQEAIPNNFVIRNVQPTDLWLLTQRFAASPIFCADTSRAMPSSQGFAPLTQSQSQMASDTTQVHALCEVGAAELGQHSNSTTGLLASGLSGAVLLAEEDIVNTGMTCATKRTYQPSVIIRKRRHGFLSR